MWVGGPVTNMSSGNALPAGGEGYSSCPNYAAPNVIISDGLAQLDVPNLNLIFQGYVTPQGVLAMRTGAGQHFEGQVDAQNVLRGRVIGACVYDATWRKSVEATRRSNLIEDRLHPASTASRKAKGKFAPPPRTKPSTTTQR